MLKLTISENKWVGGPGHHTVATESVVDLGQSRTWLINSKPTAVQICCFLLIVNLANLVNINRGTFGALEDDGF